MKSQFRIKIRELPPRARKPSGAQLSSLFGGCGTGNDCEHDKNNEKKTCCNRCVAVWHNAIFNPTIPGSYSGYHTYTCE